MKRKISAVISLVLCVCVLLGSSAAAQENYVVDSSAQTNYTENVNISQNYSESLPNVSKSNSKSTVKTPFIITFIRSTPSLFGEITGILFTSQNVNIKRTLEYFCLVKTGSGVEGYVFKGWLSGGKDSDLSLNRTYDHVFVGATNSQRTKATYNGTGTVKWSTDKPEIISVDSDTGLVKGLAPGIASLIARVGTNEEAVCTVACMNDWVENETSTATNSVNIKSLPGENYQNLKTIPAGTSITALGDFANGSNWIYVKADNTWGFIKLSDFPGIDYLLTEYHYYDQGYELRFKSANSKIYTYASVMNDVMMYLFKLKINPYVYAYTSPADRCKNLSYGSLTFNNLAASCPKTGDHDKNSCLTTSALRNDIYDEGKNAGNRYIVKTAWTGHIMDGYAMSNSQTNPTYILVFTTGNTVNQSTNQNKSASWIRSRSIFELMHETSHQFGLTDHYCKEDGVPCSNKYCTNCYLGFSSKGCIMDLPFDTEAYPKNSLVCNKCSKEIRAYLDNLY